MPIAVPTDTDPVDVKPKDVDIKAQVEMDDTIVKIRQQSDKLQAAAAPYAEKTREYAERRPVLFTFLAIFCALSAVPVLCFVTFVIAAAVFCIGVAAAGICISLLVCILFATSILIPVLCFTFFLASSIVAFLLVLFTAHRLYLHLAAATTTEVDYEHVTAGVQSWYDETKGRAKHVHW